MAIYSRFLFVRSLSHFIDIPFRELFQDTAVTMSKKGDFAAVRKDIVGLLHQPEYDDGSAGPVLVRLAWYVVFYSISFPDCAQSMQSLSAQTIPFCSQTNII